VERATAVAVLDRLHAAQGEFYAGGVDEPLRAVLAEDIEWHVPGRNAMAGDYRGIDAVMAYFARRRDHAARTLRLLPGEVLVGDGEHVAVLVDGVTRIGGREERWSTVGLYRLRGERVAACRLLPLDAEAFDRIWA
jgi:ketosteroid isomerase-like protein